MFDLGSRLGGTLALVIAVFVFAFASAHVARAADDIVIADFEGADYRAWKTSGDAFGSGPAHGTLPDQMPVSGFQGRGLVNSYLKGDGATGTLTSPQFQIERPFVNFLVGGGNHPGETSMNLLVDGKPVRSTTGSDSEHLDWETWDVAALAGKTARIEIVDRATGGWGHILVDQIEQSDKPKAEAPESVAVYHEWLRPQFHFTAQKNWHNDPNGLVFYKGEYHLFFQHNPHGINWGEMTWGHAISSDLLHWKQLDHALLPDSHGTMFSGSAVVDWNNTAGFQTGDEKPLICIFTAAGGTSPESKGKPFTQGIAYSIDLGRTWKKYDKNPVLGHVAGENRDPKVIWHGPTKRWVMALYLDGDKYALFSSPDLKQWEKLADLPAFGANECPDFFEIPVAGEDAKTKWILWGSNGNYLIGSFDGKTFSRESGPHKFEFGSNFYAAADLQRHSRDGWPADPDRLDERRPLSEDAVQSTDVDSGRAHAASNARRPSACSLADPRSRFTARWASLMEGRAYFR